MEPVSLSGVHHVALTVRDLARSERWYTDVLGCGRLQDYRTDAFDRVVLRHPCGLGIALTHHRPDADEPFSERRPGLDHLALGTRDRDELERWAARLDRLGVAHSGVQAGRLPGAALLAFRDPDGIQLEIYTTPG